MTTRPKRERQGPTPGPEPRIVRFQVVALSGGGVLFYFLDDHGRFLRCEGSEECVVIPTKLPPIEQG